MNEKGPIHIIMHITACMWGTLYLCLERLVFLLQFDDRVHVSAVVDGGGQRLLLPDPSLLLLYLKVELLNTKRFLRH